MTNTSMNSPQPSHLKAVSSNAESVIPFPGPGEAEQLPDIFVNELHLREATDQAIAALLDANGKQNIGLYRKGDVLVNLITQLDEEKMIHPACEHLSQPIVTAKWQTAYWQDRQQTHSNASPAYRT